jgi:hypothetical protein
MTVDQPTDVRTFRQVRPKVALAALAWAVGLAVGVAMILYPVQLQSPLFSPGAVEIGGWFCAAISAPMLVASFMSLAKPTVLVLAPDGLTLRTASRAYTRPWTALSNFRLYRGKRVCLRDTQPQASWIDRLNGLMAGSTLMLPGQLDARPDQVLAALQSAKRRWG